MKWTVLAGLLLAGSAMAQQTFYRCEVDGVIVFSHQPCNQEQIDRHAEQQELRGVQPAPVVSAAAPVRGVRLAQLDTNAYCERLRQHSGSYQIRATCMEQERAARARVQHLRLPAEVALYCNRLGEHSGSYQIMETCAKQELAAMRR